MFSCIETIDMRKHGQKVVYKRCLVIEKPTKCCLQDGFVKLTVIRWLKTCEMNDSSWTMGQLSEFQIGEIVLISFCCVLFRLSEMVRDMCIYIYMGSNLDPPIPTQLVAKGPTILTTWGPTVIWAGKCP